MNLASPATAKRKRHISLTHTPANMACTLDPAYVQLPEHRPKPVIPDAGSIPVIDLSRTPAASLVAEIGNACREWGFFQVINHGIPHELIDRIAAAQRGFFALSPEQKAAVRRDSVNPWGYYEAEHTKNVRDWKEVFDFFIREPSTEPGRNAGIVFKNQWPETPLGFREACEDYADATEALAFKLLELIALSLDLPPDRFNRFYVDQTSFIRLNYYPPCPRPDLALGVGRHKDSGALTVLYQDNTGGLDVKRRTDDEWVRVKPIPYSFIINIGDVIQVWSNDRYVSAEHRVSANLEKERFSIPLFFNPSPATIVKPLEEMTGQDSPPKFTEYDWGKFLLLRKASNFRKMEVENVQISAFRIN